MSARGCGGSAKEAALLFCAARLGSLMFKIMLAQTVMGMVSNLFAPKQEAVPGSPLAPGGDLTFRNAWPPNAKFVSSAQRFFLARPLAGSRFSTGGSGVSLGRTCLCT